MNKPITVLGHRSSVLASKVCKPILTLCSVSAEITYSLSGTEWQEGFELTGESPPKINEIDKRL